LLAGRIEVDTRVNSAVGVLCRLARFHAAATAASVFRFCTIAVDEGRATNRSAVE